MAEGTTAREGSDGADLSPLRSTSAWRDLWFKEDWWAIWLGLGLVLASCLLYAQGISLKWIAVTPARWSTFEQLIDDVAANATRYLAQFGFWLVTFYIALLALGFKARNFVPAFCLLYAFAVVIFALGQWDQASRYNLEPPLVALLVGLALSNLIGLPHWLDDGFRVEFYVKIGIVLLGATLPVALIVWAGPIAILQASIVSVATYLVIFWASRWLGIDRRFAATLGVGGAVCGVSAAIAISGAVGGRKQDTSIAITTVIVWAIVMIFVLPFAARALSLHAGVAGAWIGTSEFADAAGFAAAQAYGNLVGKVPSIAGTSDQTVWAFTLMKVVGRDVWIGIWAFVLALVATTRWEASETGRKPDPGEIWRRFPKFVLGFIAASLLITFVTRDLSLAEYNRAAAPALVAPLKDLRTWTFIFCFLSIGLTTRFKELVYAGVRPFSAFSIGVVVNVVLGFLLSTVLFGSYWQSLAR
jgi:uncharacterized integral membrane protein (TIGR00698 family)